jgi:hypothetical protein
MLPTRVYAYERHPRGAWKRVEISNELRSVNKRAIREEIYDIRWLFRLDVVS